MESEIGKAAASLSYLLFRGLSRKMTSSPATGASAPSPGFDSSALGKRCIHPSILRFCWSSAVAVSRLISNLERARVTKVKTAYLARKRPGHRCWPPSNGLKLGLRDKCFCLKKRSESNWETLFPQTSSLKCS